MSSTVVEISDLHHVILFKFQKMLQGGTPRPVLSFSRLWQICANASSRMEAQGIAHALRDKKNFARQFFTEIDFLESAGLCSKKEEQNGSRTQLISLSLTQTGCDYVDRTIFGAQERAQEPEVIWNPRELKRYRGPII